jgi:hypothetical protein
LPGSALLVGLAAPKNTSKDTRRAVFVLVHPTWTIVLPIDPDSAQQSRVLAAQVNKIAETRKGGGPEILRPTDSSDPKGGDRIDRVDRLERIDRLNQAGTITDGQAAQLRKELFKDLPN